MASYAAGQKIRASYFNIPAVWNGDITTADGTTSSTSYVNTLTTTGIVGVSFTAPYSGQVSVIWSCTGRNSTSLAFTITSVEVRAGTTVGSGAVVFASDDNTASAPQSASSGHQCQHNGNRLISGLTYGNAYNTCITYRVTAGTGTFNRRSIEVSPES